MKTLALALILGLLAGCGAETAPQKTAEAQPLPAPDEKAATAALRGINTAQADYFKRNRRYALTYEELMEAHLLNSEPAVAGTGYEIRLRPAADAASYTVSAVPAAPSPAVNYFFTNQTGIIRAEQGKNATVESPASNEN